MFPGQRRSRDRSRPHPGRRRALDAFVSAGV